MVNLHNILHEPVFVLGNGPSISRHNLAALDGRVTIGTNRIFKLYCPTVLFWQDRAMWQEHQPAIMSCPSVKICRNCAVPKATTGVRTFSLMCGEYSLQDITLNKLRGSGSSAVIAAEIAYLMGARAIVLLGCDARPINRKSNFYGNNPHHNKHVMKDFVAGLVFLRDNCPIPVYSCSDDKVFTHHSDLAVVLDACPAPYSGSYQQLKHLGLMD